ncbi:MAG TPA: hypothetical protein VK477_13370, partial [Acidobacteriota bacterium]|nr:hypothetical protein [Acidobacteriota bacterium]
LTSGMSVAGDLPAQVTVQGLSMTADGYVLADQVLTDSRYALTKVSVTQTGTTTNALTARVDSSGGTTVASGALSATAKRVALTLTADAESAGGKKVHLSGIAGATITPVLTYTRSA